jgi:hypothetical protein
LVHTGQVATIASTSLLLAESIVCWHPPPLVSGPIMPGYWTAVQPGGSLKGAGQSVSRTTDSFVGAVSSAILASLGLEALGLGPQNNPTIGMTIYWSLHFNAIIRGMWWWWLPPMVLVVALFIGLFLISVGLDEIANPRRRRQA